MDIATPLIHGLVQAIKTFAALPIFWVLAAAALLGAVCRLPIVKGWIGEWFVNLQARLFLSKRDYIMVPNVTIPDGLGGTTQIDHVVVSRYGVFVVETKNMKGWIFGGEHDSEWTQKIHGGHSKRFQNPLRQNRLAPGFRTYREHVRYVKGLKENSAPPQSAETAPVRTPVPTATPATLPIPSPSPVVPPPASATGPLAAGSACPRCGSTLVTRTAKQGPNAGKTFLGCSGFPKCRFVG